MTDSATSSLLFFRDSIDSLDTSLLKLLLERDRYVNLFIRQTSGKSVNFGGEHRRVEIDNLWNVQEKDLLRLFSLIDEADSVASSYSEEKNSAEGFFTESEILEYVRGLERAISRLTVNRILISRKVGMYKKREELSSLDPQRKEEILNRYKNHPKPEIRKFYTLFLFLHDLSVEIQDQILSGQSD